jgi:uncharacterized protein YbaP (TraB family)
MKNRSIHACSLILLCFSWLTSPANAQSQPASKSSHHSLWKIQGAKSTVYLLGSVHLLKQEDYPLPAVMEAAFTNSQIAVFEADVGQMSEPETQAKMMSKAQLPDGETLRQHLTPETYAAFSERVGKAGLPPAMFDTFKPLLAVSLLEMTELQKMGCDPRYGLDEHFFAEAKKSGKQIIPLETVDFQIDLFTGFSKEDSESIMKAELKDIDNTQKDFADIIQSWREGDTAKLEKLLHSAMIESPVVFKKMLTDRNKKWAPRIEELARGSINAIVIVGAGHLVGKDGVVELLKKKGLKITQE